MGLAILIGIFLGFWFFTVPGYFLICGPLQSLYIPHNLVQTLFLRALILGGGPGVITGFLGWFSFPNGPRRAQALAAGALVWIPATVLAWLSFHGSLALMSHERIGICILATIFSAAIATTVSRAVGEIFD